MPKTRSSIMTRPPHSLPFQPKYDSAMVNSGYGIAAEPLVVDRDGLADDLSMNRGVELVLRKGRHLDLDAVGLAAEFLEAGAGDQGKIAGGADGDVDFASGRRRGRCSATTEPVQATF